MEERGGEKQFGIRNVELGIKKRENITNRKKWR